MNIIDSLLEDKQVCVASRMWNGYMMIQIYFVKGGIVEISSSQKIKVGEYYD